MSHRNRNENRDHKARKDPKKLARRTKVHKPARFPESFEELGELIQEWENEGGNP